MVLAKVRVLGVLLDLWRNYMNINKLAEKYVNNIMKEYVEKDIDKSIRYTNNELYNEAVNMYNSFIKQFYQYKTKSYIRHWEGVPGTKEGQNLYFGIDIKKNNGWKPTLSIRFPDDLGYVTEMADGYQHDSPEDVLNYVSQGYRFIYKNQYKIMTWTGNYIGKYFKYGGVMKDAFDEFDNQFDKIAKNIIKKQLEHLGY